MCFHRIRTTGARLHPSSQFAARAGSDHCLVYGAAKNAADPLLTGRNVGGYSRASFILLMKPSRPFFITALGAGALVFGLIQSPLLQAVARRPAGSPPQCCTPDCSPADMCVNGEP